MNEQNYNGKYLTGFIIAFTGAILFSTKAIIVKLAFSRIHIDAVTLLAIRMFFALPFYIVVALFAGNKKSNIHFTPRQWLYVILLGLAGYYLSSLFDFIGLQYVSAGLERLILFLYPTLAILINAVIFKQRVDWRQRLALVLTYAGIGIAYFGELKFNTGNPDFLKGSFYIFLCAITFSVYIAGSGRLIPQVGATKFTSYAMIAAGAGVLLHYFISGKTALSFSSSAMGFGLLLAIIATVIPTFLISLGIKRVGSNNVAIISSIGPVSTIAQAHFILGEKMFAAQIIGTILVISGIILTGWKRNEI